jgi:hypothetical protein
VLEVPEEVAEVDVKHLAKNKSLNPTSILKNVEQIMYYMGFDFEFVTIIVKDTGNQCSK